MKYRLRSGPALVSVCPGHNLRKALKYIGSAKGILSRLIYITNRKGDPQGAAALWQSVICSRENVWLCCNELLSGSEERTTEAFAAVSVTWNPPLLSGQLRLSTLCCEWKHGCVPEKGIRKEGRNSCLFSEISLFFFWVLKISKDLKTSQSNVMISHVRLQWQSGRYRFRWGNRWQ